MSATGLLFEPVVLQRCARYHPIWGRHHMRRSRRATGAAAYAQFHRTGIRVGSLVGRIRGGVDGFVPVAIAKHQS